MKTPLSTKKATLSSLHQLTYHLQQSSDELLDREVGVGLSAVRIMSVLHERVPHSQRTIASLLRQTEANVSRQLKIMHKSGLVKVIKNKKDGRQRDVTLTTKGKKKNEAAQKLLNKYYSSLISGLSKKDSVNFEQSVQKLLRTL
jgi:DNA-binding MarR family transcriptional regulator